ncbi:MAG: transporter substrate-binding domain-containing protein [bacterium]|nr:transporter substrate-binding domain-containing protein [bacterium]
MRRVKLLFLALFLVFVALSAEIKSLRVGITDTPPLVSLVDGKAEGFFIDIIEYIAKNEGWELFYIQKSISECIDLLREGKIELIADIGYSAERDKNIDFNSENVLITWAAFYGRRNVNIVNYDDLNGKKIAVESNDFFVFDRDLGLETTLKSLGIKYEFIYREGYKEVFEAVARGDADVGVANKMFGNTKSKNYSLYQSDLIFLPVSLRYASAQSTDSLLIKTIDSYLSQLKSDKKSVYYSSLSKHIEPTKYRMPVWLVVILSSVSAFALLSLLYFYSKYKTSINQAKLKLESEESSHNYTKLALSHMNKAMYEILDAMPVGILCLNEDYELEYSNSYADQILFEGRTKKSAKDLEFEDEDGKSLERLHPFKYIKNNAHSFHAKGFTLSGSSKKDVLIGGLEFYDPAKKKKFGLFSIEDITNFKKLEIDKRTVEDKLIQAQRYETMGQLVGGIAHDFNNILSIIQTNAEYSEMNYPDSREQSRNIIDAASMGANLSAQLLLFGKKQPYVEETLNLSGIVEEFIKPVRRVIRREIEIEHFFEENVPPIKGDFTTLRQILLNLIINARDAIGDESGKMEVKTFSRKISSRQSFPVGSSEIGLYTCISVKDSGVGLDMSLTNKIFEASFTMKDKGNGLGLWIVKNAVLRESGFIEVRSQEGKGAEFIVCFPAAQKLKNRPKVGLEDHWEGNKGGILLAEDDEALRKALFAFLKKNDYTVYEAPNLEVASSILNNHSDTIKIVITDVNLPDGRGTTLMEMKFPGNEKKKFIFTSAYVESEEDYRKIVAAGAIYIQKPYSPKIISEKVQLLLNEKI